jgi:tol-pal system protein YbgF
MTHSPRSLPLAVAAIFAIGLAGARADTAMADRLAHDQATMVALDRGVASARDRLGNLQVADLFGPTEEEKAAAEAARQHEITQDSGLASINQRASDLEDSIRRLTGQIEELNHRIDELDQRIDRVKKDFDYKLCGLSAQQLGAAATPGDENSVPCGGGTSFNGVAPSNAQSMGGGAPMAESEPPQGVTHLAPGPGVLGTLPADSAVPEAPPASHGAELPAPAGGGSRAQFDAAMDLLAKARYDEARSAFRNFADLNPKDPLAAQALYWMGDVAFVEKDYAGAARAFTEQLKKYPASPRGADGMLKLGQSLLALNQKAEACLTLNSIAQRYPGASKTVLGQADAVRRSGGCRH